MVGEPLRLLLAGDVMTGRGIDQVQLHRCGPHLFESCVNDARDYVRLAERVNGAVAAPVAPAYVWGEALAEMDRRAPHLRIVNLETAVTTSEDAWPGKGIHYRMHPDNLACLTVARIDACALANNHVLDWGREGLRDTLSALDRAGIRSAGAGAGRAAAWSPAALRAADGSRVLLFSFATASSGVPGEWEATAERSGVALLPGLSPDCAAEVAEAVRRARRPGDTVVISLHWGANWGLHIPEAHRAFAHALIDGGAADVVHGHSSHHPLPVEVYRGKPILYGCGDLINDYEGITAHGELRSDVGCLYFLTLERQCLSRLRIVPFRLRRLRLQSADAAARRWLADTLNRHGHGFAAELLPDADGSFLLDHA